MKKAIIVVCALVLVVCGCKNHLIKSSISISIEMPIPEHVSGTDEKGKTKIEYKIEDTYTPPSRP